MVLLCIRDGIDCHVLLKDALLDSAYLDPETVLMWAGAVYILQPAKSNSLKDITPLGFAGVPHHAGPCTRHSGAKRNEIQDLPSKSLKSNGRDNLEQKKKRPSVQSGLQEKSALSPEAAREPQGQCPQRRDV